VKGEEEERETVKGKGKKKYKYVDLIQLAQDKIQEWTRFIKRRGLS